MSRTMLQTCEQGLLIVHAEVFFAVEGVFECVNVRDVDPLPRFELVESMGSVGRWLKEAVQEIFVA